MKDLSLQGFDMHRFKQWNPKTNPHDASHLMPILTPAFPCMNSTHNVSETTKRVICSEIGRAWQLVDNVGEGEAGWERILEPLPFFGALKYFLQIEVVAKTEMVHAMFKGWVESRLRMVVQGGRGWGTGLENLAGVQCHPWPGHVEVKESLTEAWPYQLNMYIGLVMDKATRESVQGQLKSNISMFVSKITGDWSDASAHQGQFDCFVKLKTRKSLPPEIHGDAGKPATETTGMAAESTVQSNLDHLATPKKDERDRSRTPLGVREAPPSGVRDLDKPTMGWGGAGYVFVFAFCSYLIILF